MRPPSSFTGSTPLAVRTVQCQWRKQKSNSSLANQPVSELFLAPKRYCALDRKPTQANLLAFYEDVKKYGRFTGPSWLLSPEPPVVNKLPMPSIEEMESGQ